MKNSTLRILTIFLGFVAGYFPLVAQAQEQDQTFLPYCDTYRMCGFMNQDGVKISEPIYESVGYYIDEVVRVRAKFGHKYVRTALMDQKQQFIVPPKYYSIGFFRNGLAIVGSARHKGYIDKSGKEVITPYYTQSRSFDDNGLAIAALEAQTRERKYPINQYGIIDKSGNIVVPFEHTDISHFKDGLYKAKKNGYYGYYDRTGKLVIPIEYAKITAFSEGFAVAANGKKAGFVNREGKLVVPMKYHAVTEFSEGVAGVKKGENWYFINTKGKKLTGQKYEKVGLYHQGVARVKKLGKWYLVDKEGKDITELPYDRVFKFKDGIARIWHNKKYGYIDADGKNIIPAVYDRLGPFSVSFSRHGVEVTQNSGLLLAKLDGRLGIIDTQGKVIVPIIYENVARAGFQDDMMSVVQAGKIGFVNAHGREVIAAKYTKVEPFRNGFSIVAIGPKDRLRYGVVNKSGREVVPIIFTKVIDATKIGYFGVEYSAGALRHVSINGTPVGFAFTDVSEADNVTQKTPIVYELGDYPKKDDY